MGEDHRGYDYTWKEQHDRGISTCKKTGCSQTTGEYQKLCNIEVSYWLLIFVIFHVLLIPIMVFISDCFQENAEENELMSTLLNKVVK